MVVPQDYDYYCAVALLHCALLSIPQPQKNHGKLPTFHAQLGISIKGYGTLGPAAKHCSDIIMNVSQFLKSIISIFGNLDPHPSLLSAFSVLFVQKNC